MYIFLVEFDKGSVKLVCKVLEPQTFCLIGMVEAPGRGPGWDTSKSVKPLRGGSSCNLIVPAWAMPMGTAHKHCPWALPMGILPTQAVKLRLEPPRNGLTDLLVR